MRSRIFILLWLTASGLLGAEEKNADAWIEVPLTREIAIRPGPSPRPEGTLRIASWNIEWFPAGQRGGSPDPTNLQIAAVANILNEIQPDILLTQETRNLRALERLNQNMGLWPFSHLASSWFYKRNDSGNPDDRVQQQNGILSRHPWDETWEVDFTPLQGAHRPPRGWLAARFRIRAATLTLYTGHLKSDYGADSPEKAQSNQAKRAAAIDQLALDLERRGLDPYRDRIIVAGDFNADIFTADRGSETIFDQLDRMGFRSALQPAQRSAAITVPAREGVPDVPDLTLDYIWLSSAWGSPPPPVQIISRGASKKKDVFGGDAPGLASDHYPIYVDVQIPVR
jgi:endonuclease/exonuclease/phosphatase family metal-dependent hydrolase